jgi:hypothetical protein
VISGGGIKKTVPTVPEYVILDYVGIWNDEMGVTCRIHGEHEKCVQNFVTKAQTGSCGNASVLELNGLSLV